MAGGAVLPARPEGSGRSGDCGLRRRPKAGSRGGRKTKKQNPMMKRWLLLLTLTGCMPMVLGAERDAEAVSVEVRVVQRSVEAVPAEAGVIRLSGGLAEEADPTVENRAGEILERLAAEFRAMKGYEVDFALEAGEYRARGRYAVEGMGYELTLGDVEVYCDGTVRYEVDKERREVTIVGVDTTSRNLLNNPVRAFDFLGDDYRSELLSEAGGKASVRLTPVAGSGASVGTVTVTVSTATMRPEALDYDYEEERIHVDVLRVAPLPSSLQPFDRSRFEGYEFIDFR